MLSVDVAVPFPAHRASDLPFATPSASGDADVGSAPHPVVWTSSLWWECSRNMHALHNSVIA